MQSVKAFIILVILVLLPTAATSAQTDSSRYENTDLGIAFDMPVGWNVSTSAQHLVAGSPADIDRLNNGLLPQNLVLLIRMGTYNSLGIESTAELSGIINQLVLPGIDTTAPIEVNYGDANGFEVEFTAPTSALTTRVVLLIATDGRVAIIRGMAPQETWFNANPQLQRILLSFEFTLPASMSSPLESIPDDDGGVLWHYQIGQFRESRPITLGGITYDDFGVMYLAAGARGFLTLDQETGDFINFLGPIFSDDNLADVAIGPDTKLYFANAIHRENRRIMVIDRVGNLVTTWGVAGEAPGQFAEDMPRTIAVSPSGDVWTASEGHSTPPTNRLYRFDQSGNFIAMFDLDVIHPGLHNVHLDMDWLTDRLYVVGEQGGVNVLTWRGDAIATGMAETFLNDAVPTDITTGFGDTFIVATENEGFLLMNTAGIVLDRFGYHYDNERGGAFQPGEYQRPVGLTVTDDGTAYFAETHPETGFAQVQSFRFTGEGNLPIAQRLSPTDSDEIYLGEVLSTGGELQIGDTVRGMLTNRDDEHVYTFAANMGDQVVITLRDVSEEGELDPRLVLLDGRDNRLAESDDIGPNAEGLDSKDAQLRFVFTASETYTLAVTRFGGQGTYELSLQLDN